MSDTKILQALLDGQTQIRKDIAEINTKVDKLDKTLTTRIDKIGLQLAKLEDDAPTIDEFEKLVRRVTKLENKLLEN